MAAAWCRDAGAIAAGVDSPCGWSRDGGSREAERTLSIHGERIPCFSTPTEQRARGNPFYSWVRNGLRLFRALEKSHGLFDPGRPVGPAVFETFPHAVVCCCQGKLVRAKRKASARRDALLALGYDITSLRNVDFLDAALCAHAAWCFHTGRFCHFGNSTEGYIVVPLAQPLQVPQRICLRRSSRASLRGISAASSRRPRPISPARASITFRMRPEGRSPLTT
jgi:predicted nuclease with RNAse H fold